MPMFYRSNDRASYEMNNGNYKKAIDLYEQDLKYTPNSSTCAALYCELGRCYFFAEAPYKNATKAVELFNKSISMDFHFAKTWLAFCYIFGDGVPVDLQKAVDLFKEADEQGTKEGAIDRFADFVLCHLVDLRILLELHKQGKLSDIVYVLSDPTRRATFTEITTIWRTPIGNYSNRIEQAKNIQNMVRGWRRDSGSPASNSGYYDSERLQTLSDTWERVFNAPAVNDYSLIHSKFMQDYLTRKHRLSPNPLLKYTVPSNLLPKNYYNPKLLEWIRHFHYRKGAPRNEVVHILHISALDPDIARQVYDTAFGCLVEMTQTGFSI